MDTPSVNHSKNPGPMCWDLASLLSSVVSPRDVRLWAGGCARSAEAQLSYLL